jgi:hypothetical protein
MERKEQIRKYKETPRPMGVFCVRNKSNGRFFIGTSVNLPGMLNRLRFQLDLGNHPNAALQQDWKTFGAEVFEFDSLDTLPPSDTPDYDPTEDLRQLENMWREKLSTSPGLDYNPPSNSK